MAKNFESFDNDAQTFVPSYDTADEPTSLHEREGHMTFSEMCERIELEYPVDPDDLASAMKNSLGGEDPRFHFYSVRKDFAGFMLIEADTRIRIKNNLEPDEIIKAYVVLRPFLDKRGNTLYVPITWYQDIGDETPPPYELVRESNH